MPEKTKAELEAELKSVEAELKSAIHDRDGAVNAAAEMTETINAMRAEIKAAKEELAGYREVIKMSPDALQERDDLAQQVAKLESELIKLRDQKDDKYEMIQPNPLNPHFVFDGLRQKPRKGFYLHEKYVFEHDSGYANYLQHRAIDTINRAFLEDRVGGSEYKSLPPFSRDNELHVIVYVVPKS